MSKKKIVGKVARIIAVVAAVLLAVVIASCMVVTAENEYTLIMRFGKIDRIRDSAGLSFRVPFLETQETLPRQILVYDLAPSDVITKDK
ncbi:MAG: protease modulator HflC, partial [Parasporobacterium sp.]|nr:protease modulator HflC [Parasporobacterium sp.]